MRLSWNEIRIRAATFAREWAGKGYEKGETQLFYREFFEVFGVPVRRVASFEQPVRTLGDKRGYIDLFWKGLLLVEQKSVGRSLTRAKEQALNYFPGLGDAELPRYVLLSDFQNFELHDLESGEEYEIALADLPMHVEKFSFIIGLQKHPFRDQDPVNIPASELMGELHDALERSGYTGHELELFLVRMVFCLFADDTGIFDPRGSFLEFLETRTREDGTDLGLWLALFWQVLNTPVELRATTLDSDISRLPYVDGELFSQTLAIPSFDSMMRRKLIDACRFDWSRVSPAIFGSLFQSVMDTKKRRAQGAHYTTETNILKVIEPLFLQDLKSEFERLKARKGGRRRSDLAAFHKKLGTLTFFDPACGCGNFLVIAYRELRELEIELIRELRASSDLKDQRELDATVLSRIDVDQFYGIDISEFPVRIAETAMWMMDHIMNNRLSNEFGQTFLRIPLSKSPQVMHGDALDIDWETLLPADQCSYVLGNPPFIGSKQQSARQRAQVRRIAALGRHAGGTLDYVCAWFIKAGEYARKGKARTGFVATNSITQGEQVAQLWPILFDRHEQEIAFAHQTFAWGSDARGVAHVHVVIIGLAAKGSIKTSRRLFSYDTVRATPYESEHLALSPYLFPAENMADPHVVVRTAPQPTNGLPRMRIGSKPIDNQNYIFEEDERVRFLASEPGADKFMRPYVGAREFVNNGRRWILSLQNASARELRSMPHVLERMRKVAEFRRTSTSANTRDLADFPEKFHVDVIPTAPFLALPKVSTERREYIPIDWLEPPTIPSDLVMVVENASKPLFGLLSSSMHMTWLRRFGGRLASSYRYSIGLVYNTFPMPPVSEAELAKLEPLASAVLDARRLEPASSLADLYDPAAMPTELHQAHRALDRAVDRLYRKRRFTSDLERARHLLELYEKSSAPLTPAPSGRRSRNRRR